MTTCRSIALGLTPFAKTQTVVGGTVGLAMAAAVLGGVGAQASSAATTKPRTLNVLEVDTSFVGTGGFNAKGNTPPAVGQGVVIDGSLYKLSGRKQGARYGPLHTVCTFTTSEGASVCTAVASLPAGRIVASGLTPGNTPRPYTVPILGGSGRYAGATGHIRIKPVGGSNSNRAADTIVLTG